MRPGTHGDVKGRQSSDIYQYFYPLKSEEHVAAARKFWLFEQVQITLIYIVRKDIFLHQNPWIPWTRKTKNAFILSNAECICLRYGRGTRSRQSFW